MHSYKNNYWLERAVGRFVLRSGLLSFLEHQEARYENLLRVLTYHRIGDPQSENGLLDPSLLNATPEMFEQQIRFLVENYRLLSILDLLLAIETRKALPPRSVMITFDDGYRNFLDTAWPILEQYHVPTLLFLATNFISSTDQLFWWDKLYQGISKASYTRLNLLEIGDYPLENGEQRWETFVELKRQISGMDCHFANPLVDTILEELDVIPETTGLLLNWTDARFLNERGCYLASHTRNHLILSKIPCTDASQEIRGGYQDICREIGTAWPVFAYPSGQSQDIDNILLPILKEEGFMIAMTSIPGMNIMSRDNLLRLKRIDLSPRLTMPEFRLLLTGVFHFYCSIRQMLFN